MERQNNKLSTVPIYNEDDDLECAVKSTIVAGEEYKNMDAVYRLIGAQYFGLNKIESGPNRNKAKNLLKQYAEFERLDPQKRRVRCSELYEIPQYNEPKEDNRGKSGTYVNNIVPLLINYLWNTGRDEYVEYKEQLAVSIGLVSADYPALNYMTSSIEHDEFTIEEKREFRERSNKSLSDYLKCALNRLMKDFHCITWEETYRVRDRTGYAFIADETLKKTINIAEREALMQMDAKNVWLIYRQRRDKEYHKLSTQIVCDVSGQKVKEYHKILRIHVDKEKLKQYADMYTEEVLEEMAAKIKIQFAQLIYKRAASDFNNNQVNSREEAQKLVRETLEKCPEIKELYDIGIYTDEDLLNNAYAWVLADDEIFTYPADNLDSQPYIIQVYIGVRPLSATQAA